MSNVNRSKVFEQKGNRCWYCGGSAEQVDHVNPRILGGGDKLNNLVPVCKWCNKSKRGYPLEVWRRKLSLKMGLAFTDEQRSFWRNQLPEDCSYVFWFETQGGKDEQD